VTEVEHQSSRACSIVILNWRHVDCVHIWHWLEKAFLPFRACLSSSISIPIPRQRCILMETEIANSRRGPIHCKHRDLVGRRTLVQFGSDWRRTTNFELYIGEIKSQGAITCTVCVCIIHIIFVFVAKPSVSYGVFNNSHFRIYGSIRLRDQPGYATIACQLLRRSQMVTSLSSLPLQARIRLPDIDICTARLRFCFTRD
jgi:hypothetical protein